MSMKKFNKATLAMAVAGALAASSAHAVNIAEDGLGDFIISPFYTVRGGFETYINVHNTSEETVVFKIRFREHYNSRDARDFNVILSPFDVWTAAVTMNADGTGARVETSDRSCTAPISIRNNGGIDFTNLAYSGANADGGPTNLERTTQGYFEIINMGQDAEITGIDNDTDIANNAEHVNGEPRNCGLVEQEFAGNGIGEFAAFDEPENSLKVNVAIINVNDGLGFAVPVTTLANFYNPEDQDQTSNLELVRAPATDDPNVLNVLPDASDLHSSIVGTSVHATWNNTDNGADAVSSLLMRTSVINQFRIEEGQAETDWVVTLPTKNFYVDPATEDGRMTPFVEMFGGAGNSNGAGSCFVVNYNFWDREERTVINQEEIQPSPPPVGADPAEICREMNILEFGEGILAGFDATNLTTPFGAGWMRMDVGPFDNDMADEYDLVDDNGVVFEGLPMIGFAMQNLDNWSVSNELVQYGFAWPHSYGRSIWSQVGGVWVQLGANPAAEDDLDSGTAC